MTKEELIKLRRINFQINCKIRQLEELQSKKFIIGSFDYSKDKVQTCCQNNFTESLIEKIIDLQQEINSELDKYLDLKYQAKQDIDKIEGIYGVILNMRYLEGLEWEKIAAELGYSLRYIYKLHGKALQKISSKTKRGH